MSAKERHTHPPQTQVINPILMLAQDPGIPPPGDALLDTAPPYFTAPTRGVSPYLTAFGSSDPAELERLLPDDAFLEMTGTTSWYSGEATCVPFIAAPAIGRPATGGCSPPCFRSAGGRRLPQRKRPGRLSPVLDRRIGRARGGHRTGCPAAPLATRPVRTNVTRTETRV